MTLKHGYLSKCGFDRRECLLQSSFDQERQVYYRFYWRGARPVAQRSERLLGNWETAEVEVPCSGLSRGCRSNGLEFWAVSSRCNVDTR